MTLFKNKFSYFTFILFFIASSVSLAVVAILSPCEKMRPPMQGIESIQDLSGQNLSCMDLRNVHFHKNVNLSRADLTKTKLAGAILTEAILSGADLSAVAY